METNEIINNEEVIETSVEEIASADSGNTLKTVAGIGFKILVGVVIYKYVAKPIAKKIKAKKDEQKSIVSVEDIDDYFEDDGVCEADE